MQNTILTYDFSIDSYVYEIHAVRQLDGIEVQTYHEGKLAIQFASEFADWDNSHDLATYHKIDLLEDMIHSMKSRIVEYHNRQLVVALPH